MSLAQKDQLLEIGSRARLGKPIICGRLSVSRDKSHPFQDMKFEQIFSLRCHTEQAESQEARRKSLYERLCQPASISTRHPSSGEEATILADCAVRQSCGLRSGGAGRDRTDDILLAKQALSQLSYGPLITPLRSYLCRGDRQSLRIAKWWAWEDLNLRPHAYQARALTN